MICVIWSIHRLSLGLLWRKSRPGKVARSTATGTEPSLKYCTFFRCNPSDTNLSTCAQWLGREDVRCSTLVPRSHTVKKTDANSYTRLISKYFVARCRKPQSLKMKNRQKITRTSQGLLSFYSWRSLHTWKDGLLLRQASSLVSFFLECAKYPAYKCARKLNLTSALLSRVFISYFTTNENHVQQNPIMQATRESVKESTQVKRIVRAKTSSIFFPLSYTFYRKSYCIFGFPLLYVCACSSERFGYFDLKWFRCCNNQITYYFSLYLL